ncbi:MAG: hypothetical protein ACREA1_06915 [Nitrosotalea sp.]
MEQEEPNDVIVLSAISQGAKKFDKILKKTKIDGQELNTLLERLEQKGMITLVEKKGWLGSKKELVLTDKGTKELEERRFELQQNWNQMVSMWKSGDKQKLQQHMEEHKSILPSMMFMGIMDMMMFSTMMGFMGMAMTSFMPDQYMDSGGHDMGGGHDAGSGQDASSGQDFSGGGGFGDGGPGDMGGFDVNF